MGVNFGELTTKTHLVINFGKFEHLLCLIFNIKQCILAEEILVNLW